ncbi:hypothetical protein [Rhizobium rosettiformans]|uniref:hypothetical protein n=1 Tax=Rhizobium rosettiformans TaxID=1368430 RepID=UPI00285E14EA|nr:hypothetical protein [Rhizobium rosettiformans]MDR7029659.1 hypothetical protein [Rhizobium rosettiformans]MDR7063373.1 hypothetical protein [Rhizobium rosettiformans]
MPAKLLRAALVTTLAFVSVPLAAPFAAPASAQDVELRIGPDGVRPIIRDRDRDRRDRGCSPREAQRAAAEEGLRRAEVVRVTDRSVTVRGFTRRGPEQLRFANRRGCPLI